jgi:hypothetical protein
MVSEFQTLFSSQRVVIPDTAGRARSGALSVNCVAENRPHGEPFSAVWPAD